MNGWPLATHLATILRRNRFIQDPNGQKLGTLTSNNVFIAQKLDQVCIVHLHMYTRVSQRLVKKRNFT